ncbi:MAG: PIG-L family deacetylase [Candidatus Omnitrophota bacterium]
MRKGLLISLAGFIAAIFMANGFDANAAEKELRIIAFGAHPDDCEIEVGPCAYKWAQLGHKVKFVSVTNGDIGHSVIAGGPLALRRTLEANEAAKILGIETQVLDIHDGELMPTLENRKTIIRLIREWNADIVITNRPNDYHPDHRYTSILVQDAAYMVTVPFICPDVQPLKKNPVFLYWPDGFQKPYPFSPDIAVGVDDAMEPMFKALDCLKSQFHEEGAGGNGDPASFFKGDEKASLEFTKKYFDSWFHAKPEWKPMLEEFHGKEAAAKIRYAKAYELCEYGRIPNKEELKQLFPFFSK